MMIKLRRNLIAFYPEIKNVLSDQCQSVKVFVAENLNPITNYWITNVLTEF